MKNVKIPCAGLKWQSKILFAIKDWRTGVKIQKLASLQQKTNVNETQNKKYIFKKSEAKLYKKKHIDLCLMFYIFNVICKKIYFKNN
jgi:hypothetical protein